MGSPLGYVGLYAAASICGQFVRRPAARLSHLVGSARHAAVVWGGALLVVCWTAKLAVVAFRLADGSGASLLHAPAALALLHDDLWATLVFALVAAGLERLSHPAARAARGALYAIATFWIAFNVPVARVLSSPMTYSFLHATGGALGDSITANMTVANLGVPALIWVAGLCLPRWLDRRPPPDARAAIALGAAAVAFIAVGQAALARVDTMGLHRNALAAIAQTSTARFFPPPERPSLASPSCRPLDPVAGLDLGDLRAVAKNRNVVWVVLESTAARALALYGAPEDVTPNLTRLASTALVFDRAYAGYPESIKGLFSLLCGRSVPPRREASELLPARAPCDSIATRLARAGYHTGLFHSGWFAYLGMETVVQNRGFQTLVDARAIASPHRTSFGVDDHATAEHVLAFVDSLPRGAPFFAVYMPIAGHHPYHAPGVAARPRPERSTRDEYLNDLAVSDQALGHLRAGLVARGLDDHTLYVVLGDHGEAFGEHPGNIAHALFLYEENVHVPLVIAAPGAWTAARRVPQLVGTPDIAPTTLALLGLDETGPREGRSALASAPAVARFFTEQGVPRVGLRDGRWKAIFDEESGRAQLFDLNTDRGETRDLAPEQPALVARYRRCLGE